MLIPRRAPFLLALAGVLSSPVAARAQMQMGSVGGGAPMPVVVDIKKVPVGTWAEYSISVGQMPPMKTRFALVGREKDTHTVEMTVEGGMMAMAGGRMAMKMVLGSDETKPDAVKKLVMQIGDGDPMEMPATPMGGGPPRKQFEKPDPKKLVGKERVTVPAGSFATEHYHDTTPRGEMDAWVSKGVLPFGLVKMEFRPSAGAMGPGASGPVRFELGARGKDAKPVITKPAKPFDQSAFMGAMMGGARRPGAPGAMPAPGSAAPAPPPAKTSPKK